MAGHLAGIITDGDLRRHMEGLLARSAAEVMTRAPRTITPGALAETALGLMQDRKITCLFVADQGSAPIPRGILHIHDLLRAGVA
jgi:arabinose-5-phosphate isomerase